MRNLREDLKHLGYDQEEAYFYKHNRELTEKFQARLKARKEREEAAKASEKEPQRHRKKKAA